MFKKINNKIGRFCRRNEISRFEFWFFVIAILYMAAQIIKWIF